MSAEVVSASANAPQAERRRGQIGGVVGADVDPLALARFRRRLGADHRLLTTADPFAGDWDACYLAGVRISHAHGWQLLLRQGRLHEVEGAFAVAWLDDAGALHLARDGIGERTMFYARYGSGLAFASTLRPLLEAGIVPRALNVRAVPAYLTFGYLPGRETFVDGIDELLPGEHLIFRDGMVTSERIWKLPREDELVRSEDDYRSDLRERLERAVRRRLPPSGPLAATLSGGIDSSLVVALARRLHEGPISTYSISFGPGIPNELPFSALVAEACGVEHRVLDLSPQSVIDRFDATLGALSKPIGEPLTVANAVLFEAASEFATVVFNGEGGDPSFGGPKNVPMLLHEVYGPPPGAQVRWRERAYLLAHRKCFADLEHMLAPDVASAAGATSLEELVEPHLNDARWPTLVNRLTALNVTFKGAHHILSKVDHLSRVHGVLPRSPLFDRSVVEAALRMPANLKLRGTVEKYILKRAVEDLLPAAIVARPKSGMRVPVEAWLEGRFERFARERLLDGLAPYGLFSHRYLTELARSDRDLPPPRRGVKIWLLLSLEAWLRTVLADRER